jgi:methionine salvage enolase-phosphatase E1
MIELYDVGRVITGPFKEGYKFIAEQGERYIQDKAALEEIRAFHRDRSKKISQAAFNCLNHAWTEAIRNGELPVNPSELVYKDVKPRFEKVRARGDEAFLLTSGSKKLTDSLVGDEFGYDGILVGEEIGDKNESDTFARLWGTLEGHVLAFYDDKPRVLNAAYQGFSLEGGTPNLYLVDRTGIVHEDKVKELEDKGVIRISSFDEIND